MTKLEGTIEAKVPTPLMSQANEDCHDDDSKKKMSLVQASPLPKHLPECSPVVADRISGDYWKSPVQVTRSRKSPQFSHSPNKKDECTHKITPPNINNMNTCTIFFHNELSYLLGFFVETVEASFRSARIPGQKLVLVPNKDIGNYFEFL